ncbi:Cucumber peeling cupredoxin, putative [Ricinus communis]|uniref:Cucumber peeling cupredoxin, putative n=1 Tax=Ricinus communis TaxID=3988 RepID=B9SQZ5_RICCO|nr:Cucumber peeling cupredoxin, putative [Ricinus communis]|eukprot:XP_002528414.1 chemocyanin [Ricinus communis]
MALVTKMTVLALGVVLISVVSGGKWVEAADNNRVTHHVVGGDRGWDSSTDMGSWSAARTFRVGDRIWFTYSMVQGRIAELRTKEEYESCDVSNPIRMYTDGLDAISLEQEGIRYFVSSDSNSCKNGLKLHVEVLPHQTTDSPKVITSEGSVSAIAAGPTPSGSAQLGASCVFLMAGLWLSYFI